MIVKESDIKIEMYFDCDAPDGPGWYVRCVQDDGHELPIPDTRVSDEDAELIAGVVDALVHGHSKPATARDAVVNVNQLAQQLRRNQDERRRLRGD